MASRDSSALILLALFAVALVSPQVALAHEASNAELVIGWKNAVVGSNVSPLEGLEVEETDLDEGHGMTTEAALFAEDGPDSPGSDEVAQEDDVAGTTGGEMWPYVSVPSVDEVEASQDSTNTEQDQVTRVGAHPLARILLANGATKCWTNRHCRQLVKSGACCNRRCADLATSNTNCGKCNKACNRRGYACRAGLCVKPPPTATCSKTWKCTGGKTCCKGLCQNLQTDAWNCERCGRACGFGSGCCGGECTKLVSDRNNCGQCGRRCGGGTVCCNGQCVNLKKDNGNCSACGRACGFGRSCCNGNCVPTLSDKYNCGACGKRCGKNVKCHFGICGYGH